MRATRGVRLLVLAGALALLPACAGSAGEDAAPGPEQALPQAISSNVAPLARADGPDQMRQRAIERGYRVTAEGVLLDVQTRELEPGDRPRFEIDGIRVKTFSAKYQRVAVVARAPAAIRALARIDKVRRVEPAYGTAQ